MRATATLLLILGFAAFAEVAVIGAASKTADLRPHEFTALNAYARPPALAVSADQQRLLQANAWAQYRAQVKVCGKEPVNDQDACLQQARRERKQNSGLSRKSHSSKPKLVHTQIASVE